MFLFFELFHEISDLLDTFHDVVEAAEGFAPEGEKRQLEKELSRMQYEFREMWMPPETARSSDQREAGAYLEGLLHHADTFRRHAKRLNRADLVRGIDDLQAQIKACRAYRILHEPPPCTALPRELVALICRPSGFAASMHPAF
jgi:uncharacterized coiled-coil DUF342 family protein